MSCTEWGNATLVNVPWIETDWDDPEPKKEINKMTKLEQFVQDRLDRIKGTSDTEYQKQLFHQAFGAIELACSLYPAYETEIAEWWNTTKWTEFWDIIGGR